MSWAASRRTSRLEDMAYCLLGVFGRNMPLLYGEGKGAFLRLQLEILQHSGDESIFAWTHPEFENSPVPILADWPDKFSNTGRMRPLVVASKIPIERSSRGLVLELPWHHFWSTSGSMRLSLNCFETHSAKHHLYINLVRLVGVWYRMPGGPWKHKRSIFPTKWIPALFHESMYLSI